MSSPIQTQLGYNLPDCNRIKFDSVPTLFYKDNFNDLDEFFKKYEKEKATDSVKRQLIETENNGNDNIRSSDDKYGLKDRMKEQSFRFLYNRTNFVYRDIYDDLKAKIWSQINKLLRNQSIADILKKNFEWNDKELGIFSFDRAALSMFPKYAYYSFTKNRTYQEDLVNTVGDGEDAKYYLKENGEEINLCYEINLYETNEKGEDKLYIDSKTPINIEEINQIGYLSVVSNIKNSFIHQVPKPKIANAIRIFIDFGCNWGINWNQKIYCGMFGIILSEFFESMGYSTSIVPYIGYKRYSEYQSKEVYRLIGYQAKKFSETLETEKLLLSCSDIAFFRTRFFFYAHLISDFYGDEVFDGIGFNMSREEKQCSIIQEFKVRDKNINCFYYNIADIYSEQEVLYNLTYLIYNLDNENKKLNEIRLGVKNSTILTEQQLKEKTNETLRNP